jgi:16S rRNA (cytosine967-C5)-methyltransferase
MRNNKQGNAPSDAQVIAQVCRGLVQVVVRGRTLDWLRTNQDKVLATPLHQALLYGTARYYFLLQQQVSEYLAKPLRNKDQDVFMLMLVGAYQLHYSDKPDHAAVNNTVNACPILGKPWARGLVNGVLRKVQRDIEATPTPSQERTNDPDWLVEKITQQYQDQSSNILRANDQRAPMVLRINTNKTNLADYCGVLDQQGIQYRLCSAENAVVLTTPQPAASLPGWQHGHIAVQELAAQFPASILLQQISRDVQNPTLFDACSAPGGKLFQLHEGLCSLSASHRLIGNDKSASRLDETQKIGERLGHNGDSRLFFECGDATSPGVITDMSCDAILLDAPCSGSGTIRRNPDIRILLRPEHLAKHQALQLQLLNNLWRGLKHGGTLLYSTCSVFDEENDQVIQKFVSAQSDASVVPLQLPYGKATNSGWQMLPTEPLTDGFYYAIVQKVERP